MKIPYLPVIVVASALSLASANAMPDLGRETGRFIGSDEPAPKGVRTFEPTKSSSSKTDSESSKAYLSFALPLRPSYLSFALPLRPSYLSFALPLRPSYFSFALPLRPSYLSFALPLRPSYLSFALPLRPSTRIA
jgi:hypothetical protein